MHSDSPLLTSWFKDYMVLSIMSSTIQAYTHWVMFTITSCAQYSQPHFEIEDVRHPCPVATYRPILSQICSWHNLQIKRPASFIILARPWVGTLTNQALLSELQQLLNIWVNLKMASNVYSLKMVTWPMLKTKLPSALHQLVKFPAVAKTRCAGHQALLTDKDPSFEFVQYLLKRTCWSDWPNTSTAGVQTVMVWLLKFLWWCLCMWPQDSRLSGKLPWLNVS